MTQFAAVLYHYPCPDGVFAALAAHMYHTAAGISVKMIPNEVYAPKRVEDLPLKGVDVVYLLDYVGPPGFALALARVVPRVVVLDHHKTAAEALPAARDGLPNLECTLDMQRSGATIAYAYFSDLLSRAHQQGATDGTRQEFDAAAIATSAIEGTRARSDRDREGGAAEPEELAGTTEQGASSAGQPSSRGQQGRRRMVAAEERREKLELMYDYIEDADLWRWRMPDSKAFSSGLADLELEYSAEINPDIFRQLLELEVTGVIERGRRSLQEKQRAISALLHASFTLRLGGGRFGECLAVRADELSHLRSEAGNQLAAKSRDWGLRAMGAVVYREARMEDTAKMLKVSLRSLGPHEDTTAISQAYGGGGHCNASSFLLPADVLETWKTS
eukprot:jgi/Mesen1/4384/ME000222S03505